PIPVNWAPWPGNTYAFMCFCLVRLTKIGFFSATAIFSFLCNFTEIIAPNRQTKTNMRKTLAIITIIIIAFLFFYFGMPVINYGFVKLPVMLLLLTILAIVLTV